MTLNHTQCTMHDELDNQLNAALAMAIVEATPSGRALVIRRVVERLAAVVAADPYASDGERDSLLFVLEAADEHCWRLGAFSPQ